MVILIRAGLGLDPEKLKKLSLMVFRLAFLPCLMESCVVAVASKFILGQSVLLEITMFLLNFATFRTTMVVGIHVRFCIISC